MQVKLSGKHIDLGQAFQEYAGQKLEEGIAKYLDRVTSVEMVATKEGPFFRVDIHANTGTHSQLTVNSRGEDSDIYVAFDQACEKVEKQLRRYKRRITSHHKHREAHPVDLAQMQARHYTLAAEQDNHEELEEDYAPAVIAEQATKVETLTVSEAVMRLDLGNLPALMFYNSAHGRINVIYRREDGHISWLDPEEQAA